MTVKLPEMKPVQSSNIQSLGHDGRGLFVRFNGGGLYQYPDVPVDVYQSAFEAPSVGSWFSGAIRGRYEHKKLDG